MPESKWVTADLDALITAKKEGVAAGLSGCIQPNPYEPGTRHHYWWHEGKEQGLHKRLLAQRRLEGDSNG